MHEYPYSANNPKGGRITIENDNDLHELFTSFLDLDGQILHAFVSLTICHNRLHDPWAESMVNRFLYCQRTGTLPYSGAYDYQPVFWLEISALIHTTLDEIKQHTCSIHDQ